ncbi:LysR family transcriptional regulator [Paludibacterium paludis]|uniref:LysR family transcriptional regulator n=1 Tax=Paludibacterium paludis TaxID=1225769 RepID=A0A918UAQ2_9NEIS|nr:LysR family transcriptional regulator [Paludibacterium paludis]GGY20059.1 LysR family transcriptional regulator [Paludibacterium paludis]
MTAIRVFVAAGRHGSFTRAAGALGITQSAVSRHIASLEALAGRTLFARRGPTIALTPAGSQFYEAVKEAVSTIELAAGQLVQGLATHDRLTVRTSMPSFAMSVVVPALGAFMADHFVKVDLVTSLSPPEPREEFDVLITRDLPLPGMECWSLSRETLVCVGSPAMVSEQAGRDPHCWPLIAARSRPDALPVWALARGLSAEQLRVGAVYDHFFLAVAAAAGGAGLLVAPQALVRDALRTGALALADPEPVPSGETYVAYVNAQSHHMQAARAFCRWLKGRLRDGERGQVAGDENGSGAFR